MDALLSNLSELYLTLGLEGSATEGDLWSLLALVFLLVSSLSMLRGKKGAEIEAPETKAPEAKAPPSPEAQPEKAPVVPSVVSTPAAPSWRERLSKGLARSRSEVWGKLGTLFSGDEMSEETLEEVEELLYGADIGPTMVSELMGELGKLSGKQSMGAQEFKDFLFNFLHQKLAQVQEQVSPEIYQYNPATHQGTKVIMVVGVNGAGKTTTIGKLATKLTRQGAKVVVGACDTFRAAAVDQLQVWCERAGAQMIRAKEGASPSGVGYEALQAALSSGADYCILDTAGRLHTAANLMDELKKSKEVLRKLDSDAPEHTLLVLDAITGQNALRQAEEFHKTLDLSGLIFTKCDGSSKAGSAIGIVQKLGVPLAYIGVGESVEDLNIFNLDDYLNALLDRTSDNVSVPLH